MDECEHVTEVKQRQIDKEVETKICEAKVNCSMLQFICSSFPFLKHEWQAVFQDMDFEKAVHTHKYPTPPENVITLDDDIARSAESGDGYTLVEYLPKMITEACVVYIILDSKSIFHSHT